MHSTREWESVLCKAGRRTNASQTRHMQKKKLLNWWLQEPDMPPSMLFIEFENFLFHSRRLFSVFNYARFSFKVIIIYGVTSFLFGSNELIQGKGHKVGVSMLGWKGRRCCYLQTIIVITRAIYIKHVSMKASSSEPLTAIKIMRFFLSWTSTNDVTSLKPSK